MQFNFNYFILTVSHLYAIYLCSLTLLHEELTCLKWFCWMYFEFSMFKVLTPDLTKSLITCELIL